MCLCAFCLKSPSSKSQNDLYCVGWDIKPYSLTHFWETLRSNQMYLYWPLVVWLIFNTKTVMQQNADESLYDYWKALMAHISVFGHFAHGSCFVVITPIVLFIY